MKRALIILALVIVLAGVGVAVYFYFFNNKPNVVVAPPGAIFPAAGPSAQPTVPVTPQTTPTTTVTTIVPARLAQISTGPVVPGEAVINVSAQGADSASDVTVYYIERQSGNVFTYSVRKGTITRISNRTIPGIESATWLPGASSVFIRYLSGADLSTINTYALPSNGVGGFFLPQNLSSIAVSSTSVLALASSPNGSTASVERSDGSRSTAVFLTPLSSLRASFAGSAGYLAFTKPSATLAGSVFIVDKTGHFNRIAGPLNGLVALSSHSGKWVLVSYVENNEMKARIVNTTTGESLSIPVATIADKCVWEADDSSLYCGVPVNPQSNYAYPDDWYQGAVHFSDRIWKVDVVGRYAQLVLDFSKETNGSLDAKSLAIDPQSTTLVFVNKNDGSLWSYQL